jgi:hypothetical protein
MQADALHVDSRRKTPSGSKPEQKSLSKKGLSEKGPSEQQAGAPP